tara:strand:+ start:247 stop:669 length:423 start_codon:yes stop_codon:yes gene_type:complete
MPKEGIEKMAERARSIDVRNLPLGVKPIKHIVEEIPLDGASVPTDKSETRSYTSVDGEVYTFAFRNKDGKMLPQRIALSVYLALIEVEKGGKASVVLDAFGCCIEDLTGKQVYPIPEPAEEAATEESTDFSLGADVGEES